MNTDITIFEYNRYYRDGYGFTVNTKNAELNFEYLGNDVYPNLNELEAYYQLSKYAYVDRKFYKHQALNDKKKWEKNFEIVNKFAINERFYILEKSDKYFDVFGFSCDLDNSKPLKFYIENIFLLEKFVLYFKNRATNFVRDCGKYRLNLNKTFFKTPIKNPDNIEIIKHIDQQLEYSTNTPLIINDVKITPAEKKCLELMVAGCTMKQAAKQLSISPRTVEVHLRNLKNKFELNYKSQLIQLWYRSKL